MNVIKRCPDYVFPENPIREFTCSYCKSVVEFNINRDTNSIYGYYAEREYRHARFRVEITCPVCRQDCTVDLT